jgi:outer membrane protein assembly factor BamE (lipoprotein component of BamABCDE complex)
MTAVHSIEVWLVALTITICLLGGFGVFARWCSFSPAVRGEDLEKLRVGMTTNQVMALLGFPRNHKMSAEGHKQWLYGARMKRHVLLIEFNANDKVEGFAHGVPGRRAPRKDNI